MTDPPAVRPIPFPWAIRLLLLCAASMAWKGYRFGGSHHSVQVPILKHYVDPTLYRNDLLIGSLSGYVTWFFPGLALLVRGLGHLELFYFALYVVFHLLALAAIYALSTLAFRRVSSALLACLLYVAQVQSLGGEFSYWPRLTHGQAATSLLLWAVYVYLRGRRTVAFALCGLLLNVHALYALYVLAMFASDSALRWRERGALRALAGGSALFLLLGLPSLGWMLLRQEPGPSEWSGL